MSKKKLPGERVSLVIPQETYRQMEELRSLFHISQTATVAQAVARWYHSEPLVGGNNKEETDDSRNTNLHSQQRSAE